MKTMTLSGQFPRWRPWSLPVKISIPTEPIPFAAGVKLRPGVVVEVLHQTTGTAVCKVTAPGKGKRPAEKTYLVTLTPVLAAVQPFTSQTGGEETTYYLPLGQHGQAVSCGCTDARFHAHEFACRHKGIVDHLNGVSEDQP